MKIKITRERVHFRTNAYDTKKLRKIIYYAGMVSFQYFKKIYSKSSNPVGVFGVGLAVFKTSFVGKFPSVIVFVVSNHDSAFL